MSLILLKKKVYKKSNKTKSVKKHLQLQSLSIIIRPLQLHPKPPPPLCLVILLSALAFGPCFESLI